MLLAVGRLSGDDREVGMGEGELGGGAGQGGDLVAVVREVLDGEAAKAAGAPKTVTRIRGGSLPWGQKL